MVLEQGLVSFIEWLPTALLMFVQAIAALSVLGCLFAYLVCVVRHGPFEAFYVVAQVIYTAVPDLVLTSPRRTLAMARLAIKEAIRRRVLIVFAVFALLLLLGAWFLDDKTDNPGRLYLSFVMTATNYLVVGLAVLLSTFSLPNDIKNRTIFTVVTKPVRAGEIILGRILGFTAVGSLILVMMGLVSYVFVVRGLDHTHQIDPDDAARVLAPGDQDMTTIEIEQAPSTTIDGGHAHKILRKNGKLYLEPNSGHSHEILDPETLAVGPPYGELQARVPMYGKLQFIDKSSGRLINPIHVGYEWEYRKHIEGATADAAVWTFSGISVDDFPQGLPIEVTLDVYRSFKGNIERRISGSITVQRPNSSERSQPWGFVSDEFSVQQILFPKKHRDAKTGKEVDIFEHYVDDDGRMEVVLQCAEPAQYFGVAQGDLYLRASDRWFAWNFAKAYASLWMQMVMVICFGVMFSSFLSGAVAMMATILSLVIGFFAQEISDVVSGATMGGGPIESMVRMLTHRAVVLNLEGAAAPIIKFLDGIFLWLMKNVIAVLPRFADFNTSTFVADGFNIYGDLLWQHFFTMLAFVLVLTIAGYFFLRTREIAA